VRIFAGVAKALLFLEGKGTCHGDVKAASIMLDHLNEPKLIDSYFVNGGKTAYEIVMEDPGSMSLLSPEQMERIKHRQFEDLLTIHEDEVFAFGMTLLEAMTLETAMEGYDLNKLVIREGYHERKVKQLMESDYPQELAGLALRCISLKAGDRPSLREVAEWLSGERV
jgi:serine/threonine protein kinase